MSEATHCGYVALVGRPNVGKSTLLNGILGWHLSIVSPKPQTTRHRILGIATRADGQILFLDTPGLHRGGRKAMNRSLNRAARGALAEADLVVQVIEAGIWTDEDEAVYTAASGFSVPRMLVLNKVDLARDKSAMLPFVGRIAADHAYAAVHYVCARKGDGLQELTAGIVQLLPERDPLYAEDELTDRSERFLAAERVREQLMLRLQQELPYAATVEIESFKDRDDGVCEIGAIIWVERDGQKAIVIGTGGRGLKEIGTRARRGIEHLLQRKVYLRLWVKVREGWSDDDASLKRFGYTD